MSKEKLQEIKRQYELREAGVFLDNNDVKELMKLSYNKALEDAGESVFNMTAYTHRSQDYQHGWEDCQIEAQRKIKKLKI